MTVSFIHKNILNPKLSRISVIRFSGSQTFLQKDDWQNWNRKNVAKSWKPIPGNLIPRAGGPTWLKLQGVEIHRDKKYIFTTKANCLSLSWTLCLYKLKIKLLMKLTRNKFQSSLSHYSQLKKQKFQLYENFQRY